MDKWMGGWSTFLLSTAVKGLIDMVVLKVSTTYFLLQEINRSIRQKPANVFQKYSYLTHSPFEEHWEVL